MLARRQDTMKFYTHAPEAFLNGVRLNLCRIPTSVLEIMGGNGKV